MRIEALYPQYASWQSPCSVCWKLCAAMRSAGAELRMWSPAFDKRLHADFTHAAMPPWKWRLSRRLLGHEQRVAARLERRFAEAARGSIAYCWPTFTPPTIRPSLLRELRSGDTPVVLEMVNCHLPVRARLINEAARKWGFPPQSNPSERALKDAEDRLGAADYCFAPSPAVRDSLIESGFAADRIFESSYAVLDDHVQDCEPALPPADGPTFLFVGVVYFRKGIPLLLDAWRKAGIRGRLVVAGRIEKDFGAYWEAATRDLPGVVHLPHTDAIAAVYRSADVFVMPSFEEGSPLVTYEAMAHGLPIVATPQGAGGVVRDGIDGYVVDPFDVDRWVEALRTVAAQSALRSQLGAEAKRRAGEFTLAAVANRRLRQFGKIGR